MASTLPQLPDRLLPRPRHRPFLLCVVGLYSCRWRGQQRGAQAGDCCCNKLEGAAFAGLTSAFCLTLVLLYFWGQAENDYNDFDWFLFGNLGFWFPWSVVLLVLAAGFFIYVTVLMLLAVCLLAEGQKLQLHWSHKVGILVSFIFSVVAISMLSDLWAKEWMTLLLSFQVTAPYLHVGGVSLMTSLAWPVALHTFRTRSRVRRGLMMGVYLTALMGLYMVPLGLYSPCIKEKGTLGPAPALIGHRGAPMLAPENTLMSFEKAVEAGSDGLEADVTISLDGVPFLMHDHTLQRTTNVQQVFPSRADSPAAMFSWSQLQRLDAGTWFLSLDPFGTAASLGAEQRQRAREQSVCSLQAFLQLAAHTNRVVIFDLYRPPTGHPYRDSWVQRTLEVIHNQSSIHSSQVLWLPSHLRALVQESDPELQQTSGSRLPLEELQSNHIVKLNLHYSSMSTELIREHAAVNITTNLYVISQPWLYSLAWCSGVHSVSTDAPQLLRTLRSPLVLMSPEEYNLMWILTDVLSFVLVFVFFCFHWWRERELALCSDKGTLDSGFKFKTEMSDIWSVSNSKSQNGADGQNSSNARALAAERS
ncbi:LOW QUALITY PROTEIN: glycerophosphodiester phosphodiesterase domain-containing protein 5-like [Menidia menidia]